MIYYLQFYLNIKKKESRQAHVGILVSRKFIILLLQRYDIFSFQPNLRFEKTFLVVFSFKFITKRLIYVKKVLLIHRFYCKFLAQ